MSDNVTAMTDNGMLVLSYVATYDELMRNIKDYLEQDVTGEFIAFAEHQEYCRSEWLKSVKECTRLQADLDRVKRETGDYVSKLNYARKLLDQEKKNRKRVEEERNKLEQQILSARTLLSTCRIPEDTREQLGFLAYQNTDCQTGIEFNHTQEINAHERNVTESLLSDFSYSRSEDDLDVSSINSKQWKSFRSEKVESTALLSNRSLSEVAEVNEIDKLVATTTLSAPKDRSVIDCSITKTGSDDCHLDSEKLAPINEMSPCNIVGQLRLKDKSAPMKSHHSFVQKPVIKADICESCNKRILFGKIVLKCKECQCICHAHCKNDLPLPCNGVGDTSSHKGTIGTIADFTATQSPMVPGFLVQCLKEIERRGLNEAAIYQVSACAKEVRLLKDVFLRNKLPPDLGEIDIHVICGAVKDFLRSLQEPLITQALWNDFTHAVTVQGSTDTVVSLCQAISQLPQPNRDTLACLVLHLMRVAESPTCQMPVGKLIKVFAPIIVGYSSHTLNPLVHFDAAQLQAMVMEQLMQSSIWDTYANVDAEVRTPKNKIPLLSPSTVSLAKSNGRHLFSPNILKSAKTLRRKRKFFPTPPKNWL